MWGSNSAMMGGGMRTNSGLGTQSGGIGGSPIPAAGSQGNLGALLAGTSGGNGLGGMSGLGAGAVSASTSNGGIPGLSTPTSVPGMPTSGSGTPASNICRFFLNGGCMRGDQCPYLHELPDERHLDVNNQGFIFNAQAVNSNIVNAGSVGGAGRTGKITPPSQKKAIPKYRPPEPQMDHNVPPALAAAFQASNAEGTNSSGDSSATTKNLVRMLMPLQ